MRGSVDFWKLDGGPVYPDVDQDLEVVLSEEGLLKFRNTKMEESWWRQSKATVLRDVEIAGLILSLALYALVSEEEKTLLGWRSLLKGLLMATMFLLLLAACYYRQWYEEQHDWIMLAMRFVVPPVSFALRIGCCRIVDPSEYSAAIHYVVGFSGAFMLCMTAIWYPLRFRHHIFAQVWAVIVAGWAQQAMCHSCFQGQSVRSVLIDMCTWLGYLTSGTLLDCEAVDYSQACLSGGFQLVVLLGYVVISTFLYHVEVNSRYTFMIENATVRPGSHEHSE